MAPLGLGSGFYGVGPTIGSDNAAVIVTPTGTAVRVVRGDNEGLYFEASVLQSTFRASFTIAFWIKVVDGRPSAAHLICGLLGDGSSSGLIFLEIGTDGKLSFNFTSNGDDHANKTDDVIFADGGNAYKHIAVTMTKVGDGNSTSIIYVDGAAVATSIVSGKEITEANHAAWSAGGDIFVIGAVGRSIQAGAPGITGLGTSADIAEFAIWNVALGAAPVAKVEDLGVPTASNSPNLLVNAGDYGNSDNLVTYHKLNDYSGGFAAEQIVGLDDYKGVLQGSSYFV